MASYGEYVAVRGCDGVDCAQTQGLSDDKLNMGWGPLLLFASAGPMCAIFQDLSDSVTLKAFTRVLIPDAFAPGVGSQNRPYRRLRPYTNQPRHLFSLVLFLSIIPSAQTGMTRCGRH